MKIILSDTIRSDFSRGDESWKSFEGEQECTDDCNPVKADGINKNIGVQKHLTIVISFKQAPRNRFQLCNRFKVPEHLNILSVLILELFLM